MQKKATQSEILATTDYSLFQVRQGNRPVRPNLVKQLAISIEQENLLHTRPLVVNHHMEILDGQHRLAAAKLLGVPVYYCVVGSDDAISLLNATQARWQIRDFVHLYAQTKSVYRDAERLMQMYDLEMSSLMAYIGRGHPKMSWKRAKTGELTREEIDNASVVLEWALPIRDALIFRNERMGKRLWKRKPLHSAIIRLYDKQIDKEWLIDRIKACPIELYFSTDEAGYLRQLSKIYNFNTKRNRLDLPQAKYLI